MRPLNFCTQLNDQQLLFEAFFNITCIFAVICNYLYIVVYGIFSFCLLELIQDTFFDPFYLSIFNQL